MKTRGFAVIYGIVFVLTGIAGFIPGLLRHHGDDPRLVIDALSGRLFGLFPVNIAHSLVHLAIGVWGLVASKSLGAARLYARSVAIFYAILTILGFFPVTGTLFGLVPIYSHDIWLHAAAAIVAAVFGWAVAPRERIESIPMGERRTA